MEGTWSGAGAADQICWAPWDKAAFDRAQQEDKPVLLSISAVWCYWCQVMDQSTYPDPDVARFVNQHFVPVRVESDHRPEVNARYNVGGWPTTAFLTPHGGYIAGATYLPPDQLLSMLMEVRRFYREDKPQVYDRAAQFQQQRQEQVARVSRGGELDQLLVDRIGRRVTSAYDAINGGFGEGPKFPSAPVLQFLLHLLRTTGEEFYRVMVEKSLDRMARGELFDAPEGGFFRYSAGADWSEAQHEKMLEDNLNLARVYLEAGLLLDRPDYREIAARTVDYLMSNLYDAQARGFRGSQGAHSEYFGLSGEQRREVAPPPVDPACYTGWSAQAVSLLLELSWKLPRPDLAEAAGATLERLREMARSDQLAHSFTAGGAMAHAARDLLGDWAHLLNALLDAYDHDPGREDCLAEARQVAARLRERYYDAERGGFYDIERSAATLGYLRVREKPLPENLAAALGLLKLHRATREEDYRRMAEDTLNAYQEAHRDYGEFACGYALAVRQLLNQPVEVTLEGNPQEGSARAMVQAAARVSYPHLVVRFQVDEEPTGPAQAHICLDTRCLPPVSDPGELATSVAQALETPSGPFENIFERFTGF